MPTHIINIFTHSIVMMLYITWEISMNAVKNRLRKWKWDSHEYRWVLFAGIMFSCSWGVFVCLGQISMHTKTPQLHENRINLNGNFQVCVCMVWMAIKTLIFFAQGLKIYFSQCKCAGYIIVSQICGVFAHRSATGSNTRSTTQERMAVTTALPESVQCHSSKNFQ